MSRTLSRVTVILAGLLLVCTDAAAQNAKPAAPARQAAPPPARVAPQRRVVVPGKTPNAARPGARGPGGAGAHGAAGAHAGAGTSSPRSQLYDLVRPAPMATRAGVPAVRPGARAGARLPTHVRHNAGHAGGAAGARFNYERFVFRRAGHTYYRRYYVVGGDWYWYDEPTPTNDPAFGLAEDPNLPVCEDETDECY
jgi:hypothetical protein